MSYYFTNDENLKSEIQKVHVVINNLPFSFYTDNGVFSKRGMDFGTRTLLESLNEISGKVLDLGCGYGPIGIYVAKKYNCYVDAVDVNTRAVNLAKKNALLNKVNSPVPAFTDPIYCSLAIHARFNATTTLLRSSSVSVNPSRKFLKTTPSYPNF